MCTIGLAFIKGYYNRGLVMTQEARVEELAVRAVEIGKRHAHDLVNAQTERRRRIRDAIDEVAGEIITELQSDDAMATD